jgi:CHAT domain-containing protein
MISRWSVGGESSSRYLQRMRQELKASSSISAAMRRSTISLWAEQFATASEPVLLPAGNDADILTSGEHPLLWGGYMAIGDRLSK